jgi:hypothetical protein
VRGESTAEMSRGIIPQRRGRMKDITRNVMVPNKSLKDTDRERHRRLPLFLPPPLKRVRRGGPRLIAIGMLWYLLSQAPRQSPVDLDLLDREEAFRRHWHVDTNPKPRAKRHKTSAYRDKSPRRTLNRGFLSILRRCL